MFQKTAKQLWKHDVGAWKKIKSKGKKIKTNVTLNGYRKQAVCEQR